MKEHSIRQCSRELLESFDCGVDALNEYLVRYAKQNEASGYGRTYVACEEGKALGFYTLCSASIEFDHMPKELSKRLPRYPVPCVLLARLAVAKEAQGKGHGGELLKLALQRIVLVSAQVGIAFVIVKPKDEAIGFYEHYGFCPLPGGEAYVLPVATILKAMLSEQEQTRFR